MKAVEFILTMKDKASSTIDKIGREFSTARTNADRLGASVESVVDKMNKFNKSNAGGLKRSLSDAFSSLPGASFITNPIVAATAGVAALAKLGMENERTAISFEVLLQSQEKSAKMLGEIKKYADTTPYEKMGLESAAKTMLGFGIEQSKIMPNLKMIGDVAMGDANKMELLTLAFSQVSSAGKLQGQDLLQMINSGFNPLNEISKMTGKSMGELRKEMEKGKISSDMVEAAFRHATGSGGIFNGMMEKLGLSLGGRVSTMIDGAKTRMLQLYEVVKLALSPAVDGLTFVLNALEKPFNWLISGAGWLIGLIRSGNPLIWGAIAAFTAYNIILGSVALKTQLLTWYNGYSTAAIILNTLVTEGWSAAWLALNIAMNANPVIWIITGIIALITVLVLAYQKVGWFRGAIKASWEVIKGFGLLIKDYVVDRIKGMITGLGGLGKALMQLFKGDFKAAWQTASQSAKDLLGLNAAKNAVGKFKEIGKNAADAYHRGVAEVDEKKSTKSAKANKVIPGTNVAYGMTGGGTAGASGAKAATSTVASGGTRNTSIYINIGKQVENIVFNGSVKENAQELKKDIEQLLMEVLFAAQSVG